jgi:hypothetical protein
MDRQRRKFTFALAVYMGWIIALGLLAFTSGSPPRPRASSAVAR